MKSKKQVASNWLLGIFTLLLLFGAAFSHFFQAPTDSNHDLSKFTSLFNEKELESATKITIINQLGNYSLKKDLLPVGEKWTLISPRKLDARKQAVDTLLDSLKKIKIKKIINKDPINLSNFSLNTPTITIDIESGETEREVLQIGLTNPIDNSTYVTFKDKDAIFQVGSISSPIEAYDLAMFVDSNVFTDSSKGISQVDIYRGKKAGRPILTLKRKENIWLNPQDREVNQERAQEFVDKLISLKSQIILDVIDDNQRKALERYITRPAYTVVLTMNGQEISYEVTGVINKLPGIKNEKWQSIIITSSNKTHPMIVSKDALNLFLRKQTYFKKIQIKKLFY